jgi:D-3-phosphoglycerate dehydrogenase
MPAALLIGDITHARKEWEELSSILTLKVDNSRNMRASR